MNSEWKEINDFKGYYINQFGDVKNNKEQLLAIQTKKEGYKRVMVGGRYGKFKYIHRLVAEHFLNNTDLKPCVNHKDGNKSNNHFSNLEWCTHSENNKHAMDTGLNQAPRGHNQNFSKLTNEIVIEICDRLNNFELPVNICGDYNVSSRSIYDIKLGKTWAWLTGRG